MPLFRLFPGRPRRIFFSSACFFGGILFRLAKVRVGLRLLIGRTERLTKAKADSAATRLKEEGREVKNVSRTGDGVVSSHKGGKMPTQVLRPNCWNSERDECFTSDRYLETTFLSA